VEFEQYMSIPARLIAFYLPQFHPIPENDAWWGKGFTEWTHVARAKPLFKGHYQPRLPADLGFYDLRIPETREAQAELARNAGIEGFCYYHYWFSGKRLLERPFNEVVASGKPDFPFCLCWANQTWSGVWYGAPNRILMEQTYPGREDWQNHFRSLQHAFLDERYMRVDGKPIFVIFRPMDIPNVAGFIQEWQELAVQIGLPGIHFVAHLFHHEPAWDYKSHGFDACIIVSHIRVFCWSARELLFGSNETDLPMDPTQLGALTATNLSREELREWLWRRYRSSLHKFSSMRLYQHALPYLLAGCSEEPDVYPCAIPNWDNTPRSGTRGVVLHDSTPELFRAHLRDALKLVESRPEQKRLLFIKSWNEWAEGNYLEPDQKFGHDYLKVVRDEASPVNPGSLSTGDHAESRGYQNHPLGEFAHSPLLVTAGGEILATPSQDTVKVSVIIPSFNRRDYIARAVDSVLAQTVQVDEIIVVDDGSTDGTAQFLQKEYETRLKVVVQENQGVSSARKRGLEEAQGKWVAFLDSDDEWLPDRNAVFLQAATFLPESVAWIFGNSNVITDQSDAEMLFDSSRVAANQAPRVLEDPLSAIYPRLLCMLQSSMIRRDALIELQCFSENLRNSEDMLAAIQVASRFSFAAISSIVTRWYRTSDLVKSSLMSRGPFTEDHYRARILGYSLAHQFAGSRPWAACHEEAVRQLCRTRARSGLPIRRLAFDQFKFGTSVASISFCCAAMLGSSFIRSGGVMKGRVRTLIGREVPERKVSNGLRTGSVPSLRHLEVGRNCSAVDISAKESGPKKAAVEQAKMDSNP
jgi:Glycosyltransferase WbsX/Glycosyl transferase family 2